MHTHFVLPDPADLCSFLVEEVGSWVERGGLFLLRGKINDIRRGDVLS